MCTFWDITPCIPFESQRWKQAVGSSHLLSSAILLGLFLDPEEGGDMFLRNVGRLSTDYNALYPRIYKSSKPPVWEPQILCIIQLITK
jgi:hypothetical protein